MSRVSRRYWVNAMTVTNTMYASRIGSSPLVEDNLELVRRIAHRLHSRLPACVQIEDLIQAGMLGLLEAQERYKPGQGASFSTFAGIRIRGAMLDEIRRGDWAPRSLHRAAREANEARHRVEGREGRQAGETEVATEMGVDLIEYRRAVRDSASAYLVSLDDTGEEGTPPEPVADMSRPQEAVESASLWADVSAANADLPERERLLMSLYYDQGKNLRQIAEVLGVSESRACQLHGRALSRVRERLSGWAA